jgi:hypothetical protein
MNGTIKQWGGRSVMNGSRPLASAVCCVGNGEGYEIGVWRVEEGRHRCMIWSVCEEQYILLWCDGNGHSHRGVELLLVLSQYSMIWSVCDEH